MNMGIFGSRRDDCWGGGATWTTTCREDPRFNMSGYAGGIWSAASEMDGAIRAKAKALGLTDEQLDALTIETSAYKD